MADLCLTRHKPLQFGARRLPPRVCVIDGKPHIRTFLAETLEDLGFVSHQCGRAADLSDAIANTTPNVVVLGLLIPESDVTKVLHSLASDRFPGKVMLFGGRASPVLLALQYLGEQLGLAMLPPLRTPFRDSDLQEILAEFLPVAPTPSLPVDVEEALRKKWLELWYQPKVDLQHMRVRGAEALVRMRHPTLGVVPPAFFIPSDDDPRCRMLAEFVLERAMVDWRYFAQAKAIIEMTIHVPMSVFEHTDFAERMYLELPDHSAFAPLLVEFDNVDVSRDPVLARQIAKQLEVYNIGVSVGDVMAEPSWADIRDFPVAELQMEGALIGECDDDRLTACGMVLSLAERLGAQTVAKGIETSSTFRVARDIGFNLGQGFIFAKPMDAPKFVRAVLQRQPRSS
jgi:EAL domain-containing protein (putative c-di-GMP-specific phosphodiesterase class I)